jgi:hypothetical protein
VCFDTMLTSLISRIVRSIFPSAHKDTNFKLKKQPDVVNLTHHSKFNRPTVAILKNKKILLQNV